MRSRLTGSLFVILGSFLVPAYGDVATRPTTAPATLPATRPATLLMASTQPAGDLAAGAAVLADLETRLRAKDAEGVKQALLLGSDPDAAHQLQSLANLCAAGGLAEARVLGMDGKVDGDVMMIAAVFQRSPHDVDPDTDPAWLVRRDGSWHLILGGTNERGIMTAPERESADRLQAWYDAWHAANAEKVRERAAQERPKS